MEQKLEELTRKIEAQQVITQAKQFKSFFNQPDTFSITSRNASIGSDAFYSFTVDLPRNILQPKGLQLAGINFPQANATSFNDTELVFYYYRLKTHEAFNPLDNRTVFAEEPAPGNMYMVRLLPSYYKTELIPDNQLFGFNKTFNTYQELSDELAKCCANDLAVRNGSIVMPFIANDITISYNETLNKFQMRGNNVNTSWTVPLYIDGVTYNQNSLVSYLGVNRISLINNNNFAPNNPLYWDAYNGPLTFTYMIAGYKDQNIRVLTEFITAQSEQYDFLYAIYDITPLPIIEFIPQPLTIDGLTLNRRLGYNWDGLYIDFPLEPFLDFDANNSYFRTLYKRLRPLPLYELIPPEPPAPVLGLIPIPNNNPYTQDIYTFDGYCNLVYSSILYVYSDIVLSSSLTNENTTLGLLATVPISCATLGIAFEKQFLDNPLHKINDVVENITIELRDERNLPYYCGNNSIVTLSFIAVY
jgi:hypothetical protein